MLIRPRLLDSTVLHDGLHVLLSRVACYAIADGYYAITLRGVITQPPGAPALGNSIPPRPYTVTWPPNNLIDTENGLRGEMLAEVISSFFFCQPHIYLHPFMTSCPQIRASWLADYDYNLFEPLTNNLRGRIYYRKINWATHEIHWEFPRKQSRQSKS